mmetsp:Transcript_16666/g.57007  ORF Transcript_16666/g.57007 Transcript_16666/m.57007 type:complete len:362 (-) Transcript_16666:764-1849(-)
MERHRRALAGAAGVCMDGRPPLRPPRRRPRRRRRRAARAPRRRRRPPRRRRAAGPRPRPLPKGHGPQAAPRGDDAPLYPRRRLHPRPRPGRRPNRRRPRRRDGLCARQDAAGLCPRGVRSSWAELHRLRGRAIAWRQRRGHPPRPGRRHGRAHLVVGRRRLDGVDVAPVPTPRRGRVPALREPAVLRLRGAHQLWQPPRIKRRGRLFEKVGQVAPLRPDGPRHARDAQARGDCARRVRGFGARGALRFVRGGAAEWRGGAAGAPRRRRGRKLLVQRAERCRCPRPLRHARRAKDARCSRRAPTSAAPQGGDLDRVARRRRAVLSRLDTEVEHSWPPPRRDRAPPQRRLWHGEHAQPRAPRL